MAASLLSTALAAFGIRWTNTEDPPSRFLRAERALKNPAVWYAVNKISGHIGQLPLNLHQQVGDNIEQPTDHWLYERLRVRPNGYQTPVVFKRLLTSHALLWGNGYAYIARNSRNRATELIPLRPDYMAVGMSEGDKAFLYVPYPDERLSLWENIEEGEAIRLENREVLHIQGLGADGVCGYSLLTLAKEAWEAGNATTNRLLSLSKKGHAGGVVLEVPQGQLRETDKAAEFLKRWQSEQDGPDNAGKTAMLREGVTAKVLAMSNRDAEFVDTMTFMRQDEALRFLLETIIGDDASVSYNSLEQKNLAYLQNCLNTWLRVWEEELELKLLTPREMAEGYYLKFNEGPLLRTDKNTSADIVTKLIAARVMNPNEGRALFDLNPYEGGDEFLNPAIETATPAEEDESEEADDEEPETAATNRAIRSLVTHLVGVEANRIGRSVDKLTSVAEWRDWADEFYRNTWERKFADSLEELGVDRDFASQHCGESKRQLLAICQTANASTVPDAVRQQVKTWKSRALGELEHVQL